MRFGLLSEVTENQLKSMSSPSVCHAIKLFSAFGVLKKLDPSLIFVIK